jgi:predicted enzyme related to lactoylglutathione lyase
MNDISARFVGVEIYFDDLEQAKNFYIETLGLRVSDDQFTRKISSRPSLS